jgi:hypothetical protein
MAYALPPIGKGGAFENCNTLSLTNALFLLYANSWLRTGPKETEKRTF